MITQLLTLLLMFIVVSMVAFTIWAMFREVPAEKQSSRIPNTCPDCGLRIAPAEEIGRAHV